MILANIKSTSLKMENHRPAICKDIAIQKKEAGEGHGSTSKRMMSDTGRIQCHVVTSESLSEGFG